MATFTIQNFGCRATDADAAATRHELLARGLNLIADHTLADIVVLNTCTVTAAADAQARETVRKIHRANPTAQIVLTGCYAQRAPEELAALPGVTLVVGNSHQSQIADAISPRTSPGDWIPLDHLQAEAMSLSRGPAKILTGDIFAQEAVTLAPAQIMAGDRTRPILKIQDGCNNRCSYCVIPFVRGKSRSLPPNAVIAEVRALVAAGAKEIVVSGINLGSYGRDLSPRAELRPLVSRILAETDIQQIRFSSIEPQDITDDFVALVASSGRIAPHFHVPLQSGSNRTLRAMRRWYRAEHYAERIKRIRALMPDAAIGADVIVGFPGETDQDFAATAELIEKLPFTYLHVFSFSERPGTEAAKLHHVAVPDAIIRRRARALRALGEKKRAEFRASQACHKMRALTLQRRGPDWTEALTGNYLKVRVARHFAANEWHDVRVPASLTEITHDAETTPQDQSPNRFAMLPQAASALEDNLCQG
jgi:threonylcarbamoyladenosine tRNA methylthiotransferase MtaB